MSGSSFRRRPLGRRRWGIISILLFIGALPAFANPRDKDIQRGLEVYRDASRRIARAEELLKKGNREEALRIYVDLRQELERFKRTNPFWNNAVTNRKIEHCRLRIRKLMKRLGMVEVGERYFRKGAAKGQMSRARALEREEVTARRRGAAVSGGAAEGPPSGAAGARPRAIARREKGASAPPPDRARSMRLRDAEKVFEAAKEMRKTGSDARALMLIDDALKLDPELCAAYLERADVYLGMEKYSKAAEDYGRAIMLGGAGGEAHYGLGSAYEKLAEEMESQGKRDEAFEKYRDAISEYKEALWQDYDHAPAAYSLGCAYARIDRREDALYYFKKAADAADRGSDISRKARYNMRLLGGF